MDDLISRQQAINTIQNAFELATKNVGEKSIVYGICESVTGICKAMIMQLPSADLSARVSKALSKEETERFRKEMKYARVGLLPSAEPQESSGHWIQGEQITSGKVKMKYRKCSCCKGESIHIIEFDTYSIEIENTYCPNCGKRMEGEADG